MLGAVVLRGGADERLDQEQRGHHEEEPGGRALRRGQRDVAGRAERERRLLAPVPAEVAAPAPEGAEQEADAAEQRDQRRAPTRRSRWRSACCRPAARAASCSCTSSRGRAGSAAAAHAVQAKNAVSCRSCVGSVIASGRRPCSGRRVGEEVAVVADEPAEGGGLRARVKVSVSGALVVAVRAQVLDRPLHRAGRSSAPPNDSRTRSEERRR